MKSKWKEVLCYFVVKLILVQCDYFSIIGSAILRIDEPYRVAVTSHDVNGENLGLKVGVTGITNLGEKIDVFQELTLNPGSTKMLKFRFPNITLGTYKLTAQARNFSKSVNLYLNPQKVTLLIQLDKPIYKTSDTVNFRIFAISSRTKPYKAVTYSKIWILDPKNNELKKWENVQFKMGVFEEKFDFTRLRPGMYEILVKVDDTIESKRFEIFKDSQHIYELKLSVPDRVSFRDGALRLKISIDLASKYALENLHSISGKMMLTCDELKVIKYQKIINTTHYEILENIDFINDLGIESINDRRTFNLKAIFTDDVTKKNFTATSTFTIEMSDYQIQIVHSPKYFKIGLPYSFTLLVTKAVDEYPVLNSMEPIYVVVRDDRNKSLVDKDFELDPITGSVEIHTPEISEGTLFLNIYAKYDKIQYFQLVNISATQRSESISIDVLTARPKMYENVDFVLASTSVSTPFAVFQVFSKGLLRISKLIPFINGYANFSIIPKFSYTPKAHCIAFFITEDGDMISDTITLNFDNQFPNFIHLEANSTDLVTPGTTFLLNITSTLYSSVSILAIDQRGISQRFKHDILKDYVFGNELIKYDRAAIENFYDFDIPFWFYPLSYQKTFFEIGAVILTNAVQDVPCKRENAMTNVFDKINFEADQTEKSSKTKSDDTKRYVDGFLFETIFVDSPADDEGILGEEFLVAKLPDTSTSWAFTAIVLHNKYGFGMTLDPFVLQSYKRFYVDYSVPTSLKIGEIFLVEVLIGNLYEMELTATVKVFSYEFLGYKISRPWSYGWQTVEGGVIQKIQIPPFNVHRLLIEITAESYGNYDIKIAASCANGLESKVSTINIIPSGILTYKTDTKFIAAEDCYSNVSQTLKYELNDENIDEDTLTAQVSVYGDIMGLTLSNLDALIKQPVGSAEEILFVFALNVLTLDYLVLTDQLSTPIKVKAVYYLQQSYQKLIKYRNIDGSFSSFIESSTDSSVWLTANIYRYLRKAQRYIEVNEDVYLEALAFIASKQKPCGLFSNDQEASQVNKTQTEVAFTAFIGILFDENVKAYPQYITVVQKAVEYVELHYDKSNLYSLALVTYFMYEVDSPLKYELLQSLLSHIQYISSSNYTKGFNVTSLDVEINSYCLMILDHIPELYVEAFSIVQWLLVQQKSNGKFFSTRDTIIALEAISRFAARFSDIKENLELDLVSNGDEDHVEHVSISRPTRLIKQIFQLPPTTKYLDVSAHGDGFAIIQLSCSYYVNSIQVNDAIKLSTQFKEGSCNDYLILTISMELPMVNISDIVVVSIESPSGFVYDTVDSGLPSYIKYIEELNKGTLLNIYLKDFGNSTEFDIAFLRKFMIFNASLSNIEVKFDFNNEVTKASLFYGAPKNLPLCSNQSLTTSPPIFDFTTLEPLSTEFHRIRETTQSTVSDLTTTEQLEGNNEEQGNDFDDLISPREDEVTDDLSLTTEPEFYTTESEVSNTEVEQNEEVIETDENINSGNDFNDTVSHKVETNDSEMEVIKDETSPEIDNKSGNEIELEETDNEDPSTEIPEPTIDPENSETSEIFPTKELVDDKSGNIMVNDYNDFYDDETTTTKTTPKTTTINFNERFKRKRRPKNLPISFKKHPRPRPSIPNINRFPNKIKKFTGKRT